jgi:hypothetical protein
VGGVGDEAVDGPVSDVKKLEVGTDGLGLVLLPPPKPPKEEKVGAGFGAVGDAPKLKMGAGFGAVLPKMDEH